jgi:hypothetical protein
LSNISIKVDTSEVEKALAEAERQIPFAIAATLNNIAFGLRTVENAGISATFKHPRPFTQSASAVDKASKGNLTATVRVKDAQTRYLAPYEFGGLHNLPGQALLIPVDAKVDQYGQLPKGSVAKLFSSPGAFTKTIDGVSALWQAKPPTEAAKRKAAKKGVRTPRPKLKLLLEFGKNRPVQEHLNFEKRAESYVAQRLAPAMAEAISRTLATMKKA